MLVELAVGDLGVVERLSLVLGPGMTVLTGETGAGKTLVVTAIELLVGGRADPLMVRAGAAEARVDGRFVVGGDEVVLSRVVPRQGRSRAYVDGRPATAAQLAEAGAGLVDLHGQHAHQSLLSQSTQRAALDRFGRVDLGPLRAARSRREGLEAALAALGGDARSRAREADLLRHQVDEIDAARVVSVDEEAALEAEEELLAGAQAHREAAGRAVEALGGDGGALDALGSARAALGHRGPFADLAARVDAAIAEVSDVAHDVRARAEAIDDDPARLERVRARRQLLRDLRRKYGECLADVAAFRDEAAARLADVLAHDERAGALEADIAAARADEAAAAAAVGAARRAAAPVLAAAVQAHLVDLAMAKAQVRVEVGADDPGDDVAFLLAANPGSPPAPLARVASGGELARAMLAVRLVTTEAPPTLVFDEVDAGIGGTAALAVGRSLGALGATHQVLVVTHLAQVAAFADAHVVVEKVERGDVTVSSARLLDAAGRTQELSRMLSGLAGSSTAERHARELLAAAAALGRR